MGLRALPRIVSSRFGTPAGSEERQGIGPMIPVEALPPFTGLYRPAFVSAA